MDGENIHIDCGWNFSMWIQLKCSFFFSSFFVAVIGCVDAAACAAAGAADGYNYSDGQMTEKLCPDGMVFNDYSSDQEKCDLPYNIDCSKRPKLRKCYFEVTMFRFVRKLMRLNGELSM